MNRSFGANWRQRLRRRRYVNNHRPQQQQPGYEFDPLQAERLARQQMDNQQAPMEIEQDEEPPLEIDEDEMNQVGARTPPPQPQEVPNPQLRDETPPIQNNQRRDEPGDDETIYHDSREHRSPPRRRQNAISPIRRERHPDLFIPPEEPFYAQYSPRHMYEPRTSQRNNVILKSKINLPQFDEETPELSLEILQSILDAQQVTNDSEKYLYLVSTLKAEHLRKAASYLTKRGEECRDTYNRLKNGLIQLYAKTSTNKFCSMMKKKFSGEKRPSELMDDIKMSLSVSLRDNQLPPQTEQTLKLIWLNKLPQSYRVHLALHESTKGIAELQKYADAIYDNTVEANDAPIQKEDIFEKEVVKRLGRMEQEMMKYKNENSNRNRSGNYQDKKNDWRRNSNNGYNKQDNWQRKEYQNGRNYNQGYQKNQENSNFTRRPQNDPYQAPNTCYYHKKFKADSRKCDPSTNCPFRSDIKDHFLEQKAAAT